MRKGCRACTAALYVSRQDERSSGWTPSISPSPSSCVKVRPVHSDHGALTYALRVSGLDIHTITGAVSTARQKWAALAGSTSVACWRCMSTASYIASRCCRATNSWMSCFLVFRVSCIGSVAFLVRVPLTERTYCWIALALYSSGARSPGKWVCLHSGDYTVTHTKEYKFFR